MEKFETISRSQAKKICSEYKEIFKAEKHHDHEIHIINGVLRWKKNEAISKLNINDVLSMLITLGYDKNSEVYRKYYRDLGYSLSGYWEIFYWEMNNEDASKYRK